MTLKIAVLAPMPIARVSKATTVNMGVRIRRRRRCLGVMGHIYDAGEQQVPRKWLWERRLGSGESALLLRLAVDADARPGNGLEADRRDLVLAFHADSVGALLDAVNRLFDCPQQFSVGLFQCEAHVKVAFLARLVDPITAF
jgi:hypothetical protein